MHYLYRYFFKPLLDFLLALILILAGSPIMLACAIIMKIKEPGESVIFEQERVGYHNQVFNLYKFRTMRGAICNPNGQRVPDAVRLTRLGKWMRQLSLDELPQLFNVLLGQMSFIGPRPLLVKYLPYYSQIEVQRHHVKPGISGWAQVNGRNAISWGQRLALDVWYVDHCSFWLDLKIVYLTGLKIFTREGISAAGDATMPEFFGSAASYDAPAKERAAGDDSRLP